MSYFFLKNKSKNLFNLFSQETENNINYDKRLDFIVDEYLSKLTYINTLISNPEPDPEIFEEKLKKQMVAVEELTREYHKKALNR